MVRAPHRRFAAWYAWKAFESQEAAARFIGCRQATVSNLLGGVKSAGLRLGTLIEQVTQDWPEGPLLASEWLPDAPEPASEPAP